MRRMRTLSLACACFLISVNLLAQNTGTEAATIAVRFMGLDVKKIGGQVILNWKVASEEVLSGYSVERSTDAVHFASIWYTRANEWNEYTCTDASPLTGTAYYRIKALDQQGNYSYSAVVSMKNGRSSIILKAFPLPAHDQLTLQHSEGGASDRIQIWSQMGRLVKTMIPTPGSQQTFVNLMELPSGLYIIGFTAGDGSVQTLKFGKQ